MSDDSPRLLVDMLAADQRLADSLAREAEPAARLALLQAAAALRGLDIAPEVLARFQAAEGAVAADGAIDDAALEGVTGGAGIDWTSVAQGYLSGGR